MMRVNERLIYWLLGATRGGPTRIRLLREIDAKPLNMHQLALSTNLDYKTVQGHIKILLQHGIVDMGGNKYGAIYFISSEWAQNTYLNEFLAR